MKILKIILNKILKLCVENKIKVYAVGGPVRDFILTGKQDFDFGFDLDLMVDHDAIGLGQKMTDLKIKFNPAFKTIKLLDFDIDIATMRSEIYEKSGALPKVSAGNMATDLKRRDLTINAMAMSLNEENFGEIIDFYGGLSDLKNKIARVLHEKSFIDDPTRIFRVIRFTARFDLCFEEETENLLKQAIKDELYKNISFDRLLNEFKKIFKEEKIVIIKILKMLEKFDLVKSIDEDIKIDYALFEKTEASDWFSWFLILVSTLKDKENLMRKFNFTREEKKFLE